MILLGFRHLWTSRTLLTDQFDTDNKKESQQPIHEESDEEYEKNIKTKILGASLKFVPDMGWSKQAISAGNLIHNNSYLYHAYIHIYISRKINVFIILIKLI